MADHQLLSFGMALQDHQYASKGPRWAKRLGPDQQQLMNYVLDRARPATEIIVLDGPTCLRREDFWSLGLGEELESNIGNACFRLIEEEAQRNVCVACRCAPYLRGDWWVSPSAIIRL